MRFSKQNSAVCLQSHILAPTKFLGWLRHCAQIPSLQVSLPPSAPENCVDL